MNFGTVKARMALNCSNLQSSHPQYAYLADLANDGLRGMILRATQRWPNLQCFPEHKDVEWDDITVIGQNYLTMPTDGLAIQRAYSADSTTSPNYNTQQWRSVAFIEVDEFDQLPKTQTGYPLNWTQREGRFLLWPTPATGYTTYIKLDGFEDEPNMSAASDTPRTNIRWHPAWLDFSTYLLADACGYDDTAARFLKSTDEKVQNVGQSMVGLRRGQLKRSVRVHGMPGSGGSGSGRWW